MLSFFLIFAFISGESSFYNAFPRQQPAQRLTHYKKVVNVQEFKVFPNKNINETDEQKYDRWLKIKQAFEYCVKNKYDLFFPKGTYDVGARNFPFRQMEAAKYTQLYDCGGIKIFGEKRLTLFKTSSQYGADVLQLNLVKNIEIRDLSVTATLFSKERYGSNGISITNGFDNIILDNIYVYDLPGVDKGDYIDGGKGLTLQFDPNINIKKGTLTATNIVVENCAYGFRFDAVQVSDLLKEKIKIKLDIKATRTFQGFSMVFGVPVENVDTSSFIDMNVNAILIDSQQYISLGRVVGGNYNFIVDKTISNDKIIMNKDKYVWYKADPLLFCLLSNYTKNANVTIKGAVGNVDMKVWIGAVGSVVEPYNLKNRTENSVFDFDIKGTSKDEDVKIINYKGESIHNSKIILNSKTMNNIKDNKLMRNNNNIIKRK